MTHHHFAWTTWTVAGVTKLENLLQVDWCRILSVVTLNIRLEVFTQKKQKESVISNEGNYYYYISTNILKTSFPHLILKCRKQEFIEHQHNPSPHDPPPLPVTEPELNRWLFVDNLYYSCALPEHAYSVKNATDSVQFRKYS